MASNPTPVELLAELRWCLAEGSQGLRSRRALEAALAALSAEHPLVPLVRAVQDIRRERLLVPDAHDADGRWTRAVSDLLAYPLDAPTVPRVTPTCITDEGDGEVGIDVDRGNDHVVSLSIGRGSMGWSAVLPEGPTHGRVAFHGAIPQRVLNGLLVPAVPRTCGTCQHWIEGRLLKWREGRGECTNPEAPEVLAASTRDTWGCQSWDAKETK